MYNSLVEIDTKYDGILSMPATHQKDNCDYIFQKFCEGLLIAGFENSGNKSKSRQNALLLNPFHDNDEANFSLLENQETTPETKNATGTVFFSKFVNNENKQDTSRTRKSEDYNFEEMSFSSEIIDFWNQRPVNRNRKRIVDDFFDDPADNIFLSEVSTDPTARNRRSRAGDANNNLHHSVGDLYNFLNPDLSTEAKTAGNKSSEELLELMLKKTHTSSHKIESLDNREIVLTKSQGELHKDSFQEPEKQKCDELDQENRKLCDSPAEDSYKQKMDDGFVVMSQNSESREIRDANYLENLLVDAESGFDLKTHGEIRPQELNPDELCLNEAECPEQSPKMVETPKKSIDDRNTRECNTSYTLGSAMKGSVKIYSINPLELDVEIKTEIFIPEENLLVR